MSPAEFPQPEWNRPDEFERVYASVLAAHDEESFESAYHRLLYAIGNDHCGTYYPVLFAVLPFMESVLRDGQPWPRRAVLESLVDLYYAFIPEEGYDYYEGVEMEPLKMQRIEALAPLVVPIATEGSVASGAAQELLSGFIEDRSYLGTTSSGLPGSSG